ncbi:MAG TPA: LytTR family DNA-binding domain-containing protein [Streptosporangiaceae bacterium]|jgi:DNA-binding LytR/AlgR family response regulator
MTAEPHVAQAAALVVDDETPARDELTYLLHTMPSIKLIDTAASSSDALRRVQQRQYDVVFLDVRMPDLDGIEVAKIFQRFTTPPAVIFVTAYEEYAVRAFDVQARDYLLKPVARTRLETALYRALGLGRGRPGMSADQPAPAIPVEAGGRTRLIECTQVCWVEAVGDYVRLHLAEGSTHLIRMPISHIEEKWSDHGFVRVHRGYLVPIQEITEFAVVAGNHTVTVAGRTLPVSRRHAREVRERFLQAADRH